jgi:hypothetical protein
MRKNSVVSMTRTDTEVRWTVPGQSAIVVTVDELEQAGLLHRAALHGIGQKGSDAAAISRDPDTGKPATPAAKHAAILAVIDRVKGGMWDAPRGDGTGRGSVLFEALTRVFPDQSPEQVDEFLDGLTATEREALQHSDPDVSPVCKTIRDERAAKRLAGSEPVDTKALLGKLKQA